MDAISKFIFTGLIITFAVSATAKQEPQFKDTSEEKILQFTYSKLQRLTNQLEKKTVECTRSRKNTTLPKTIFKNLKLTTDEQRTSLVYFSRRAHDNCTGKTLLGKVIIALAQFKELEKRYRGKNTIETKYNLEILCCLGWEGQAKIEMAYQKISPKLRKKLRSNSELQKPFNPISTADNLGL